MLGVKDRMNRGECDVLVTAAIAADKVRAEKLVVISLLLIGQRSAWSSNTTGRLTTKHIGTGVNLTIRIWSQFWLLPHAGEFSGVRRMGYVDEKAMADAQRLARIDGSGKVAFNEHGRSIVIGSDDELRKTAHRAGDELAVGIRGEHRNARAIKVVEQDA